VAMVSECPEGRLHVDEDYSVVEFVPAPEAPGAYHLVGTTLDNEVFPLVRYRVGDIMRLAGPEPCRCGRHGRIVASIDGRQEDYLMLSDGALVGRVDHFFKDAVRVAEAQIIQERAGEAVFRIVRAAGYGKADETALRSEVYKRVGDRLAVSFEYVDALPRTKAGKLRLVVSELPNPLAVSAAGAA
jgi:phenylacetate-CoA ligase